MAAKLGHIALNIFSFLGCSVGKCIQSIVDSPLCAAMKCLEGFVYVCVGATVIYLYYRSFSDYQ